MPGQLRRSPQQLRRRLPGRLERAQPLRQLRGRLPEPSARQRELQPGRVRVRVRTGLRKVRDGVRRHRAERKQLRHLRARLRRAGQRRGGLQRRRL